MDVSSLAAALPGEEQMLFAKLDDDSILLLCLSLGVAPTVALMRTYKHLAVRLPQIANLWEQLAKAEFGGAPQSAEGPMAACAYQWRLRHCLCKLMSVGRGDISAPPISEKLDAIAFPSNPSLMDPGIPGALHMVHMRAGRELSEHISQRPDWIAATNSDFGGIMLGNVFVTPAFNLQAAHKIMHVVGPFPGVPPQPKARLELTLKTYRAVYAAMDEYSLPKIALSAIGTVRATRSMTVSRLLSVTCSPHRRFTPLLTPHRPLPLLTRSYAILRGMLAGPRWRRSGRLC